MAPSFLSGSNPVLVRELRAGLRSVKAFSLLALYVALLGAIVTVYFPAGAEIDLQSDGGDKGRTLFWTLVTGQLFLTIIMIPALATGALAQERERQTLEPLLLTPLSPLQIVWGKAGGVLSLVGLLLLASLPLTSLCFLLGGVSPGMLVMAYSGIFGLAMFTTGFGLYCAARWPGATRALFACYALLPIALLFVAVFLPLGALFSGLCVLAMMVYGLYHLIQRGEKTSFAQKMGPLYGKLIFILAPLMLIGLLVMMLVDFSFGLMVVGIGFVLSYFVMAAQWGLLQTARELMLRNDPDEPLRQKVADFKSDWQNAIAPPATSVYTPTPQTQSEWAALSAHTVVSPTVAAPVATTASTPAAPASAPPTSVPTPAATSPSLLQRRSKEATYGKEPFLSDRLNPIFARELRSGLLGKAEYLFNFCYIVTVVSEVGLFLYLLMSLYEPAYMTTDFTSSFAAWGRWHLPLVMIFGAWFGARAIAPEREGQTLSQLFTIPMRAQQIIGGKLASVLAFTLYVQVLVLPVALLLPLTGLVSWTTSLQFLVAEVVLGTLAAAWGTYCSFHCTSVRSALSCSLGGAAAFLVAHVLVSPLWEILRLLGANMSRDSASILISILPLPLLFSNSPSETFSSFKTLGHLALPALIVYAVVAFLLVLKTSRDFQKLSHAA
jgi:ABC-type transport system involved in multi-copper enzyme maturation permease subunit